MEKREYTHVQKLLPEIEVDKRRKTQREIISVICFITLSISVQSGKPGRFVSKEADPFLTIVISSV